MLRTSLIIALGSAAAACGISLVGVGDATDETEPVDGAPSSDVHAPDAVASDVTESEDAAPDVAPDVDASPEEHVVARLNINGASHMGIGYEGAWAASPVPGVCGPYAYAATSPLHGTGDTALFQGEAFGAPATCAIGSGALVAGTYRVRLYFAEVYFGPGCPGGGGIGSRIFDIVIEGDAVREDFDVFAESGGCLASTTSVAGTPVVLTFDVHVADGTLDIALPAKANNGKISALEVFGPF